MYLQSRWTTSLLTVELSLKWSKLTLKAASTKFYAAEQPYSPNNGRSSSLRSITRKLPSRLTLGYLNISTARGGTFQGRISRGVCWLGQLNMMKAAWHVISESFRTHM